MLLKQYRRELQALFAACKPSRKPFLRRCDDADTLFVTDLPVTLPREAWQEAEERLYSQGWTVLKRKGLWFLDHEIPLPPRRPDVLAEGEAGCVLSLLRRHPGGEASPEELRMLLKVMDGPVSGREAYMRSLHSDLAVRMRMHAPLPGTLLPLIENEWLSEEEES